MTTAIGMSSQAPVVPFKPSAPSYRCVTYCDDEAFTELRGAWDALMRADHKASIFQSGTWLKHLWRLDQARAASLRLVAVWDRGQLLALAPWMIGRPFGVLGSRQLCFVGQGGSDQHDVLIADHADKAAITKQLAGWLKSHRHEYDAICWDELPPGSHVLRHRHVLIPRFPGWGRKIDRASARAELHLAADADAVVRGLSKSSRNSVRRRWRRLEEDYQLVKEVEDGSGQPDARIADLIALHQQRRTACGDRGLFRSTLRRQVFTDLFRDLLAERRMLLTSIVLNGQVKAINAMLCDGDAAVGYNTGMSNEPRLGKYALGIQCTVLALEAACRRGAMRISLGRGDQDYKCMFGGVVKTNRRLICYRRGIRTFDAALWSHVVHRLHHSRALHRLYAWTRRSPA